MDQDRLTVGEIAEEFGERLHRVRYAIATFQIKPRWRVGIIRQWARDDLPKIRDALAKIGGDKDVAATQIR